MNQYTRNITYNYAVEYINKNGRVISYGNIETTTKYEPGDVITLRNGDTVLIDYEL